MSRLARVVRRTPPPPSPRHRIVVPEAVEAQARRDREALRRLVGDL